MNGCVVDASVMAAIYFPEAQTDRARALLVSGIGLNAPDFIVTEFANVLWKRHARGDVNKGQVERIFDSFLSLPTSLVPATDLIESALGLALQTGRTVYDCLYVALAERLDLVLYTGDVRLFNSLQNGPLAKRVALISTFLVPP